MKERSVGVTFESNHPMLKTQLKILLATSLLILVSCKEEYYFPDGTGLKPVYISTAELGDIRNLEPQPTVNTGPILLLGDLFFMIEQKKGIHVFDVTNLNNPLKITFIKIPAINDFSIRNNVLLADNGPNLVSIDISDINNVVVLNIEENVFQQILFPPNYTGFFECVDVSKGIIIDWEETNLTNARCRAFN